MRLNQNPRLHDSYYAKKNTLAPSLKEAIACKDTIIK